MNSDLNRTAQTLATLNALETAIFDGLRDYFAETDFQKIAERAFTLRAMRSQGHLLTALTLALELQFGAAAGQGMALRAGRAGFSSLVRSMGAQMGLHDTEFYLLPPARRIHRGLTVLSAFWLDQTGDAVHLDDMPGNWVWRSPGCPVCAARAERTSACAVTTGMLQGLTSWASGGRVYRVREKTCRAVGAVECEFWVEQRPLD